MASDIAALLIAVGTPCVLLVIGTAVYLRWSDYRDQRQARRAQRSAPSTERVVWTPPARYRGGAR